MEPPRGLHAASPRAAQSRAFLELGGTLMFGTAWLSYFEGNVRVDVAPGATLAAEVPRRLHAALAVSLGRFQLGESAGGQLHQDIATARDQELDPALRRSVQLYIEEEWRHSRELA